MSTSDLKSRWEEAWPQALASWSRYTQLNPPLLCETSAAARAENLSGSFAMIRLQDQVIVVDLPRAEKSGLANEPRMTGRHFIGSERGPFVQWTSVAGERPTGSRRAGLQEVSESRARMNSEGGAP